MPMTSLGHGGLTREGHETRPLRAFNVSPASFVGLVVCDVGDSAASHGRERLFNHFAMRVRERPYGQCKTGRTKPHSNLFSGVARLASWSVPCVVGSSCSETCTINPRNMSVKGTDALGVARHRLYSCGDGPTGPCWCTESDTNPTGGTRQRNSMPCPSHNTSASSNECETRSRRTSTPVKGAEGKKDAISCMGTIVCV